MKWKPLLLSTLLITMMLVALAVSRVGWIPPTAPDSPLTPLTTADDPRQRPASETELETQLWQQVDAGEWTAVARTFTALETLGGTEHQTPEGQVQLDKSLDRLSFPLAVAAIHQHQSQLALRALDWPGCGGPQRNQNPLYLTEWLRAAQALVLDHDGNIVTPYQLACYDPHSALNPDPEKRAPYASLPSRHVFFERLQQIFSAVDQLPASAATTAGLNPEEQAVLQLFDASTRAQIAYAWGGGDRAKLVKLLEEVEQGNPQLALRNRLRLALLDLNECQLETAVPNLLDLYQQQPTSAEGKVAFLNLARLGWNRRMLAISGEVEKQFEHKRELPRPFSTQPHFRIWPSPVDAAFARWWADPESRATIVKLLNITRIQAGPAEALAVDLDHGDEPDDQTTPGFVEYLVPMLHHKTPHEYDLPRLLKRVDQGLWIDAGQHRELLLDNLTNRPFLSTEAPTFRLTGAYHGPITFTVYNCRDETEYNQAYDDPNLLVTLPVLYRTEIPFGVLADNADVPASAYRLAVKIPPCAAGWHIVTATARYCQVTAVAQFIVSDTALVGHLAKNELAVFAPHRITGKALPDLPIQVELDSIAPFEQWLTDPALLAKLRRLHEEAIYRGMFSPAGATQEPLDDQSFNLGLQLRKQYTPVHAVIQAQTDHQGIARVPLPPAMTAGGAIQATAVAGGNQVSTVQVRRFTPKPPTTERIIWLPDRPYAYKGETVQLTGIIRQECNGVCTPPPAGERTFKFGNDRNPIGSIQANIDANGLVHFALPIPDSAQEGTFTDDHSFPVLYVVARHRHTLSAKILGVPPHARIGQTVPIAVAVRQGDGTPAKGQKITVQINCCLVKHFVANAASRGFASNCQIPLYVKNGNLAEEEFKDPHQFELVCDENGIARCEFANTLAAEGVYLIEVYCPEEQAETKEYETRSELAYPAEFQTHQLPFVLQTYIATEKVPSGGPFHVAVHATDFEGAPVQVPLTLVRLPIEGAGAEVRQVITAQPVTTDTFGWTSVAVTTPRGADTNSVQYQFEYADPAQGGKAIAYAFPVESELPYTLEWPQGKAELVAQLVGDTFWPGDEIPLRVKSNRADSGVFLSVESDSIHAAQSNNLVLGDNRLTIPCTPPMAPNADLVVTAMANDSGTSAIHFPLSIDPLLTLVKVNVTPDKRHFKPGADCTLRFSTESMDREKTGPLHLTVQVVDDQLLTYMEPRDPFEARWNPRTATAGSTRSHSVRVEIEHQRYTFESQYFWRRRVLSWGVYALQLDFLWDCGFLEGAYGTRTGGGRHRGPISIWENFYRPGTAVAYQNPDLPLDEKGTAQLTFKLPAEPGVWRVVARGLTTDGHPAFAEARLYTDP